MGEGYKLEALSNVHAAQTAAHRADRELRESVAAARDTGATWQEIADTLGVSKQWAWQRYWRDCGPTYHTA